MFNRIPLAWYNLTHRPFRFAVYLAGIAFAIVLMFVQLGFWSALLESFVAIVQRMDGQLVLVNKNKPSLVVTEPFPKYWLIQARGVNGVKSVVPLYIRSGTWGNPLDRPPNQKDVSNRLLIRVVAYDLRTGALKDTPEVQQHAQQLILAGTALGDRRSKAIYHVRLSPPPAELNGQKIDIVGEFTLGTDFYNDATLLMSDQNFADYFGGQTLSASALEDVDVGLIRLTPDSDVLDVQRQLKAALPCEVDVLTIAELIDREQTYWRKTMPVGFVFLLGLIVGFLVGVIICSQILSADVADHLPEYATLKAIGYSNAYLIYVILSEALLLSVLAFIPGILVSWAFYKFLEALTGLPLVMTFQGASSVLLLTMLMCTVSGLMASRRVLAADPAEVFG